MSVYTQIQHEYLGRDGFHITPKYGSVLDLQYWCAMVGRDVPCPYFNSMMYDNMLAEWAEREWPPLSGRRANGRQMGQRQVIRLCSYGGQW